MATAKTHRSRRVGAASSTTAEYASIQAHVAGTRDPAITRRTPCGSPFETRALLTGFTAALTGPLSFLLVLAPSAHAQGPSFVNWESPHVHPLDRTPSGTRLLAVNTPDNRLEVFDLTLAVPLALSAIPVGLDPVSVRARNDTEAWVVNHVGDSVSVVDLPTGRVVATLTTDDEPCDVVFAGLPERAFVSCSQANTVLVFDPAHLTHPPLRIAIAGEDPRALAVSPDGSTVYAAVFESGNRTTILGGGLVDGSGFVFPPNVVNDPLGPYAGQNPPPNAGPSFVPAQAAGNPPPPRVGLIVRNQGSVGQADWRDDNGGDWTPFVSGSLAALSGRTEGWRLPDRDLAVIDAATLSVTYVTRLLNLNMALAVQPGSGKLAVVGTEARNEVRFEPNQRGTFVRAELALVATQGAASKEIVDLNPHLSYEVPSVPQDQRDRSLGDPRGVAWSADGQRLYVVGMGSNNVVAFDSAGVRLPAPPAEVGQGPTGIVVDEAHGQLFVLNKFDASISVVSAGGLTETARVGFYDPSPAAIRNGRPLLYDTHATSGLGQVSCGSCHVDARMDRLAWDLGDPAGAVKPSAGQNLGAGVPGLDVGFDDFHPMKGPMLTQTLQDIVGKEPHHWRGDRDGLEEFAGAFVGLQGDDAPPSAEEMQAFEDFLATIHFPPNPFRELDNGLPTDLPFSGLLTTGDFGPAGQPLPNGNAEQGLAMFRPPNMLESLNLPCSICHTTTTGMGTNGVLTAGNPVVYQPPPEGPNGEKHHALIVSGSTNASMKVPHLRNLYERTGFDLSQGESRSGFGYLHDGSIDSLARFLGSPNFLFESDQEIADMVAFMLSFSGSDLPEGTNLVMEPKGTASQDTHAAVGVQVTLQSAAQATPAELDLITRVLGLAEEQRVGLVAKGRQGGWPRGYAYLGTDLWQADRPLEVLSTNQLLATAKPGAELTLVVVPNGSQLRIGIDRDEDGFLDREELDAGADPADASSTPLSCSGTVPGTPTSFAAAAVSSTAIRLDWIDADGAETAFVLERARAGTSAFTVIALLPEDARAFTDIGATCGETYDYRLAAQSCAGTSAVTSVSATAGVCDLLAVDTEVLSVSAGGTQHFALEAGVQHAGDLYWMLGSGKGTSPGFPLGSVLLPLNLGDYLRTTLDLSITPITNAFGMLDGTGSATASLKLDPGMTLSATGLTFHHAYVVLNGLFLTPELASNPVPLFLVD